MVLHASVELDRALEASRAGSVIRSPLSIRVSVRLMLTVLFLRSTSDHVSPNSSPRLMPVVIART